MATIGRYRIEEELASGAFGRVYRAQDTSMSNRIVAIKLMHSAHLRSPQERSSFLQEAEFLKMLRHPYILAVLDAGIEQDIPYIVTEYAPHGSLYNRLKKLSPRLLPMQEALRIIAQVGQALQYAHQQNIIHRDLKPDNILFNANGDALLADFGVATVLASSMKYGTVIGTPYYMAPEQFRGSISKEGDQYALGCIAYELLTGRPPFTASDFFAIAFKHMSEIPLAPTQLNLLVSRSVEQAILKAMAKHRADRHADIAAFMSALGIAPIPPTYTVSPAAQLNDDVGVRRGLPSGQNTQQVMQHGSGSPMKPPQINPPQEVKKQPQDENDEQDATVVRPLYANQLRDSLKHFAASSSQPADALPRVLDVQVPQHNISPPLNGVTRQAGGAYRVEEHTAPHNIPNSGSFQAGPINHGDMPINRGMPVAAPPTRSMPVEPWERPSAPLMPNNDEDVPNPSLAANRKKPRAGKYKWLLAATILLVLLLVGGSILYAMSNFLARSQLLATVTITPTSKTVLSQAYTLYAVTRTPDASRHQVQARLLSATFSQTRQVAATGEGTIPGVQAKGWLTFYNDSTSPQSFAAGQIYTDHDGVRIMNDKGGTVPAGNPNTNPPTWQVITVPAHAVQPGKTGNIRRADIDIWTSNGPKSSFVVENDDAFTGGKDAQAYAFVQSSDPYDGTAAIQAKLFQHAQTSLLAQLHPYERLARPVQCTSRVSSNHPVGSRVTTGTGVPYVTATITATCTGEAYDQQVVQAMATNLLSSKLTPVQNTDKSHTNKIIVSVLQTRVIDAVGTVELLVRAESRNIFQFSSVQKQQLAGLIAGKGEQDAQAILLKQVGVSQAKITFSNGDGRTVPADVGQIRIIIVT